MRHKLGWAVISPVYDADGIQLYHGRCEDVMPLIVELVDLVFADLPYATTQQHWDRMIDPKVLWYLYGSLLRPTSPVLLFGTGLFAATMALSKADWYRYDLVWDKDAVTGFLNAKRQPLRCHENILVFGERPGTYNPQLVFTGRTSHGRGKKLDRTIHHYGGFQNTDVNPDQPEGWQHPRSILKFKRPKLPKGKGHPNQKPVDLARWVLNTYTNPGDLVLDNVAGSATSLVAARSTGRRAIGIEMHEPFVEMAIARLESGSEEDRW